VLHTDADGPAMQLVLWDDADYGYAWGDYQRAWTPGLTLRSTPGTPGSAAGSWDFHIPTGTFKDFPRRCGWAILLLWNNGAKSSVLAQGIASFLRPFFIGTPLSAIPIEPPPVIIPPGAQAGLILTTDNFVPIITSDTSRQLETS